MPQSLGRLVIHLIFSTKERRAMIGEALQPDVNRYIAGILKKLECPAVIVGGAADHVHVLFNLNRSRSVSDVVEEVKTGSSKWIKTKGEGLDAFAWQNGYGAFSVSESMVAQVKTYIEKQAEHHRKTSFQEELVAFLKKHRIEYDEKFIWE